MTGKIKNAQQWVITVSHNAGVYASKPHEVVATLLIPNENYAQRPLPEAFKNYEVFVPLLASFQQTTVFDVTAFYSRRKELTSDQELSLAEHNAHAFGAAANHGGLVLYYQGSRIPIIETLSPALPLDFTPNCLSFCIWESNEQAKSGANIPAHQMAASKASEWYENFAILKYSLELLTIRRLIFTERENEKSRQ